MDLAILSSLKVTYGDVTQITVSYDLGCQWHIHLPRRQDQYPIEFRLNMDRMIVTFVVPDFHLLGHGDPCQVPFSFNYLPGSGRTCGELIETGWARYNAVASSTREMGPGSRSDTLDDHWADWNFQKCANIVQQLLKNLHAAVEGKNTHSEELHALEELFNASKLTQARQMYNQWSQWRQTAIKGKEPCNPFTDNEQGLKSDTRVAQFELTVSIIQKRPLQTFRKS